MTVDYICAFFTNGGRETFFLLENSDIKKKQNKKTKQNKKNFEISNLYLNGKQTHLMQLFVECRRSEGGGGLYQKRKQETVDCMRPNTTYLIQVFQTVQCKLKYVLDLSKSGANEMICIC